MEVFSRSRDVAVGSLTATTVAGHQYIYNANAKQDLNTLLDPIHDASHTRNRKTSPPDSSCLPGTRQSLLLKVTSWAKKNVFDGNHVYWLYGYVGCGKSAVAQAIAENIHERKRLLASFFFFRNSGARGKIGKLAATIASQMAVAIPATAPLIEATVTADPSLLSSSVTIGTQFQRLVYDPFVTAVGRWFGFSTMLEGPYLIVIDGLDECEDHEEVAEFISHMLTFFGKNPFVPLRILITSRVEEHIRTRLQHDKVTLENLVDHCSDKDIAAVICAAFDHAAKHDRVVQAYGDWPSQAEVRSLVKCSRGSFIVISMLLKYILEPLNDGLTPMERLPLALDINRHSSLDGLYTETLARSKDLPHFIDVISTIALVREPLSITNIAGMLEVNIFEVVRVLVNLHAILQVPGDDVTPVTMCHSSLHDFLTTESRSGPFYASPSFHERLANRCLDLPAQYRYPNEPLAKYAFEHSTSHFQIAWGMPLRNDADFSIFYDNINNLLRQRFPKSIAIVIPAYFLWTLRERFLETQTEILATILEPKVPAGETMSIVGTLASLMAMDPYYGPTPSLDRPSRPDVWSFRLGESNSPHFSAYMDFPLQCISLLLGSPLPQNRDRENDRHLFRRIFLELSQYISFALDRDPRNLLRLDNICRPVDVVGGQFIEWSHTIQFRVSYSKVWWAYSPIVMSRIMKDPAAGESQPVHLHGPSPRWIETKVQDKFVESRGPLSMAEILEAFHGLMRNTFATVKIRLGGGVGVSFTVSGNDPENYRTTTIVRKSFTYKDDPRS